MILHLYTLGVFKEIQIFHCSEESLCYFTCKNCIVSILSPGAYSLAVFIVIHPGLGGKLYLHNLVKLRKEKVGLE